MPIFATRSCHLRVRRAGLADAGDVAFHPPEYRHAAVGKALREALQGDSLAGAGGAPPPAVAVGVARLRLTLPASLPPIRMPSDMVFPLVRLAGYNDRRRVASSSGRAKVSTGDWQEQIMRWEDGRRSDNVEDRRGQSPGYSAAGAARCCCVPAGHDPLENRAAHPGRWRAGHFGGKLLGSMCSPCSSGGGASVSSPGNPEFSQQEQQQADFVSVVLADTGDTWQQIFRAQGGSYREPTLVLFSGRVKLRLRHGVGGGGAVLLPRRPETLHRPVLFNDLRSVTVPRRFRPGLCRRP